MLYFSSKPIDPTKIDIGQYQKLDAFRSKMRPLGLIESYENEADFKEKLSRQLTINMQRILDGQPMKPPTKQEQAEQAEAVKSLMKKDSIYIEDYEKDGKIKSFLVKGDTIKIKDKLSKEFNGKWNSSLGGWIFPITRKIEVAEFLKKNA
ncbi:hypothetical protein JAB9_42220 [Janthinobacterium sp. HH107]|nr:hypothetical protein JAB9_42220 [Janthinobacterium sp. HH107]